MKTPKEKFRECCLIIINNSEKRALKWCVNYAQAGLNLHTNNEIHTQILYILSNMQQWRGEEAKQVRSTLKELLDETR